MHPEHLATKAEKGHAVLCRCSFHNFQVYMLNKNTQGAKKARPIRSSSYQVDSYTCD